MRIKDSMKKQATAVLLALILPVALNAASFVNQPIFLSKSPATAGQKVRVYAVISNNQAASFTGEIVLAEDGKALGTSSVTIASGAAQTVSASWTPMSSGPHVISADLLDPNNVHIQQVSQTFTVQVPEAVAATSSSSSSIIFPTPTNTYQSSADIQQTISTLTPAAATTTQSVLRAIDGVRASLSGTLESAIARQQKVLASSTPAGVGSSTPNPQRSVTEADYSFERPLGFIYIYFLMFVRFVVNSAFLCYAVIAAGVPYVLWKVTRFFMRRRGK